MFTGLLWQVLENVSSGKSSHGDAGEREIYSGLTLFIIKGKARGAGGVVFSAENYKGKQGN